MIDYRCPICGNTDLNSIGILNGKPYCRRCISFKGEEVEHKPSYPKIAPIHLSYELSSEQKELSDNLVRNYKNGIDSLVYAVTGAGKTEISLNLIKYVVEQGKKVAFALPRRDVCIELFNRLKEIFQNNKVISVYGGHHKVLEGDIIIITTHQLYRYKKYFSLIILDEIDAFPFKDNPVLYSMFDNSLIGHYVMMSATPSKNIIEHFEKKGKSILKLVARFHHNPLPVPKIVIRQYVVMMLSVILKIKEFINVDKPVFIFAPTIEKCELLFRIISVFIKGGNYVHSKRANRKEIIDSFRNGQYKYLITTSVLERGVTVRDLQVIVTNSEHFVYDSGTLVQIAGRVGRKKDAPSGEVIFYGIRKTQNMTDAINNIEQSNKALSNMLQKDKR